MKKQIKPQTYIEFGVSKSLKAANLFDSDAQNEPETSLLRVEDELVLMHTPLHFSKKDSNRHVN